MHSFSFGKVQVSLDYNIYSIFPQSITIWNRMPGNKAILADVDQLKQAVVNVQYKFLAFMNLIDFNWLLSH